MRQDVENQIGGYEDDHPVNRASVTDCSLWQPIETAPRDRSSILTWDGCKCDVTHWFDENPEIEWWNGDVFIEPTHWMPLPPPPLAFTPTKDTK